ncbi:retinoblastoma-like protein 2 [Stegastes partitus]|uniref:Retinoblastoma-like protein 2 n=1 Tax=Stegastes partitus TaxID=144197 RepID=A0A9Y4NNJ8_9TELE|nr:PREDICTED: retinoblastoma-like protein 2 [Stegastes partitus]
MSDEEEFLQKARTGFEDLCRALNMDEEASTEAWKTYENISRNFTLEGSELHWLACALYVACRSSVPTVGKGTADGNYVSLTRILRCSEMSLIEFFNKMKKWQDMAKLPQDFRQSTDKLERNFTVSAVIFKKYVPIFKSIFKAPSEEPPRVHRSRKQRRHPCTVTEVFNFCWVLFVHAKGNFPMISDDLVNSYHLLLCALDLVFTNALLCNARKDLLNPEFKGAAQFYTYKLTETCARDPSDVITRRLKDMFDLFSQRYEDGGADSRPMGKDMAVKYFHLAEALYYRILESIIEREKMILGDADLSCILEQDIFHRSLLACCLEIVIFSYRPPGDFPNVIGIFQLPAYHFYKNFYDGLSVSPSPTTLLDRYSSPPTGPARRRLFVDPPADGETGAASTGSTSTTSTPPIATAVTKTGQASLVTTIPAGQTVVTVATATVTANNGQTVTIPVQGIANESGGITFFPVQVSVTGQAGAALQPLSAQTLTGTIAVQSAVAKPAVKAASSPLRKGSLSLFFRKVYHLASVRLRDLCAKLDISSELRRKIWTCFEYSLVHCTEMMMDRHLDQLLMCAVYVMAKVTKEDKSFQNIMKCYRTQPQASSNVYRSVLISARRRRHSVSNDANKPNSSADAGQDPAGGDISPVPIRSSSTLPGPQPGSAPSTPTNASSKTSSSAAASCTVGDGEEERGDLIHFYNNVYIKQMRHFALRYSLSSPSAGVESPPLCPYPTLRTGSPRRMLLSSKHSIYISPHKTGSALTPTTPRDKIYYYICSSPPNRLQEINSMIRTGETPTRKRSMAMEEETSPKRVCPDNHSALLRRLQDVANDRSSSH